MFSELERLSLQAWARVQRATIICRSCDWVVSWSVVNVSCFLRMLVERQWDYIVVSQQFAGIKRTFYGLGSWKPESTRRRVYGRCRVYRREWFVWRDVEPAGTREVRRGSCGAWWCRERPFDGARVRPVARGDRDLVPVCSSIQWTWVVSTVGSSGSSSTESPADVTDDRPSWRTFEAYNYFYYSFVFVLSVVILICIIFLSSNFCCLFFSKFVL